MPVRSAVATAAVAAATLIGPGVAAAPTQAPATATATPTDLRVGTELTISGTECIDPDSGDPGSVVAVLQRPGDPEGSGIPLASGIAAATDGTFEVVVEVANPLPNGALGVAVACFATDPPSPDGLIEIYPVIAVTGQSPPITGLEVDRTTLSFDDPCAGVASSMGVTATATLIGPDGQEVVLDAAEAVDGRVTHALPEVLAVGEWTVIAECYRRRESLPTIVLAGSFVREPVSADPGGPSDPVAPPAAPIAGDASYTG